MICTCEVCRIGHVIEIIFLIFCLLGEGPFSRLLGTGDEIDSPPSSVVIIRSNQKNFFKRNSLKLFFAKCFFTIIIWTSFKWTLRYINTQIKRDRHTGRLVDRKNKKRRREIQIHIPKIWRITKVINGLVRVPHSYKQLKRRKLKTNAKNEL